MPKGQNGVEQLLGTFIQTSIPANFMGSSKETLEKKNVSAEKYDEIRRLDGTVPCRIVPHRAVSYRTVPSLPVCLKEWATAA